MTGALSDSILTRVLSDSTLTGVFCRSFFSWFEYSMSWSHSHRCHYFGTSEEKRWTKGAPKSQGFYNYAEKNWRPDAKELATKKVAKQAKEPTIKKVARQTKEHATTKKRGEGAQFTVKTLYFLPHVAEICIVHLRIINHAWRCQITRTGCIHREPITGSEFFVFKYLYQKMSVSQVMVAHEEVVEKM